MNTLKSLLPTLISLLCVGAIFVNSGNITDSSILPKWLFTFAWLAVIGIVYSLLLFNNKKYVCHFWTVYMAISLFMDMQSPWF